MNELLKCIFRGTVLFLEEDVDICTERVKDFLLAAVDICIPTFQRRIQGEGWGVAPPLPLGSFWTCLVTAGWWRRRHTGWRTFHFPNPLAVATDRELPKNLSLIAIGDCDEDAFPTSIAFWSFAAPYRSQAQKLSDRFPWWNESRPALGQQCLKSDSLISQWAPCGLTSMA